MPASSQRNETGIQTDVDTWQSLIVAARNGCDQALGEISVRTRNYLLLVAGQQLDRGLHAKFGASDVVQQSLLDACSCFSQFSGNSEGEFRSWIKRIVINNAIDESRRYRQTHSRSTQREVPVDSIPGIPDSSQLTASAIAGNRESDARLENAILQLSPKQQQVLSLKHRFGYGYSDIANQLDMSEPAVRMLWSRAITQLKKLLELASG